jgi:hypothetical protein
MISSHLFTFLVLFPSYLTVVYLLGRFLDRLAPHHLLASGGLGVLLVWTLMGLSPWSDPAANLLHMLGLQLGVFSFWAFVATAPRVFLDASCPGRDAGRRIVRIYVPCLAMAYAVGLSVPQPWRLGIIIPIHRRWLLGRPAGLSRRAGVSW